MAEYQDFHHYKGTNLSRSEKIERVVAELLINSPISDDQRESSMIWEFKHSSGCVQIAKILAQARDLDAEIAEVASILHDIYVITDCKYSDHAHKGAPIARRLLEENGEFNPDEIDLIVSAVESHSDKQVYSDKPYDELVKDVDVFDCSLYKNAEGYYRLHKPPEIVAHYEARIKKVRKELNLPEEPLFR